MSALHDDYAFPHKWPVMESGDVVNYDYHGMTLRDWFAGQALSGLVAQSDKKVVAQLAYKIADAMLAARKNTSGESR